MSNLIPEQRSDKNGNIVTRWVRSFTRRDSAKTIPAPVVASISAVPMTEDTETQYKELTEVLQETLKFGTRSQIPDSLETIARYDPELLDRITDSAMNTVMEREFWAEMFGNKHIISDADPKRLKDMLGKCRSALVVNRVVKMVADDSGWKINGDAFGALHIGDVVDSITRGKVDENYDATIMAVTMISYVKQLHLDAAWSESDNSYVDYDEVLKEAKGIATRAEEVEVILPELIKRKAFDRETIDALLDHPVPVLLEGAL